LPDIQKASSVLQNSSIADLSRIIFDPSKILIVDDNVSSARLIKALLRDQEIDFLIKEDFTEGLSSFIEFNPDLIFLDLKLQNSSGYNIIRELKASPQFKNTPVIAYTADIMKEEKEMIGKAGFSHILPKPFKEDELTDILTKYISHKLKTGEDDEIGTLEKLNLADNLKKLPDQEVVEIRNRLVKQWEDNNRMMQLDGWTAFGKDLGELGASKNLTVLNDAGLSIIKTVEEMDVKTLKNIIGILRNYVFYNIE
jgi:CheY-like chemotaxis protein